MIKPQPLLSLPPVYWSRFHRPAVHDQQVLHDIEFNIRPNRTAEINEPCSISLATLVAISVSLIFPATKKVKNAEFQRDDVVNNMWHTCNQPYCWMTTVSWVTEQQSVSGLDNIIKFVSILVLLLCIITWQCNLYTWSGKPWASSEWKVRLN